MVVHLRDAQYDDGHYDTCSSHSTHQRADQDHEEAEVCANGHLLIGSFVSGRLCLIATGASNVHSVCVVTIVRMTTLRTGAAARDPTFTGSVTLKWTAVETNVGIICACLPLLRPILNKLIPWFNERSRRDMRPGSGYVISGVNTNSTGLNTVDSSKHNEHWSRSDSKHEAARSDRSRQGPESRNNSDANMFQNTTDEAGNIVEPEYPDDTGSFEDEKLERAQSNRHVL